MKKRPIWYASCIDMERKRIVNTEMFCTRESARIYVNTCKRFLDGGKYRFSIVNMKSVFDNV